MRSTPYPAGLKWVGVSEDGGEGVTDEVVDDISRQNLEGVVGIH
jgi:hypothetical protein